MAFRIRPATTLSIIVFIAFAFELIAILSVPVTQPIALSTYNGYKFGVFGYCKIKTGECSSAGIGYKVPAHDADSFSLPSSARKSLANLLIVHVVACALTLLLFIGSLSAHFHGPSSSQKYLLCLMLLSVLAFLISLLSFLVDILLFVSHLDWAGWIVLASTVLTAISGIILGIMRRTLSSKKAMRKRLHNNNLPGSELDTFGLSSMGYPPITSPSEKDQADMTASSIGINSLRSQSRDDLLSNVDTRSTVPYNDANDNETTPLRHQLSNVSDTSSFTHSDDGRISSSGHHPARKIIPAGTYLPADENDLNYDNISGFSRSATLPRPAPGGVRKPSGPRVPNDDMRHSSDKQSPNNSFAGYRGTGPGAGQSSGLGNRPVDRSGPGVIPGYRGPNYGGVPASNHGSQNNYDPQQYRNRSRSRPHNYGARQNMMGGSPGGPPNSTYGPPQNYRPDGSPVPTYRNGPSNPNIKSGPGPGSMGQRSASGGGYGYHGSPAPNQYSNNGFRQPPPTHVNRQQALPMNTIGAPAPISHSSGTPRQVPPPQQSGEYSSPGQVWNQQQQRSQPQPQQFQSSRHQQLREHFLDDDAATSHYAEGHADKHDNHDFELQ